MRSRGFTLLEVVVSATLLSLITGMVLLVYSQATRIGRQTEQQASMVADAQVGIAFVTQAVRESARTSLSVGDESFSLLSPRDEEGDVELQPDGRKVFWNSYRVFYRNDDTGEILRRIIELPATPPELREAPQPLTSVDLGEGVQPHEYYHDGGRTVLRRVSEFEASFDVSTGLVEIDIVLVSEEQSRVKPTTLEFMVTERCRN